MSKKIKTIVVRLTWKERLEYSRLLSSEWTAALRRGEIERAAEIACLFRKLN